MLVFYLKEKRSVGVICFFRRVVEWKTLGVVVLVDLRIVGFIFIVCGFVVIIRRKFDGLIFLVVKFKVV